ncbi:hypothetical protein HPB52_021062 [Rhipicephalus sanguineus]|uniref:Uncharacterized protein n=1 Tax=Rhipicephalus sanguineus TaxID=34632 RepID=A0A9D4PGH6_RHISA|nr:hypothetical protein HPB52_021062 [Rhipicephalus sanguineus]
MTEVVDLIGHFGPWQACFVAFVTYRGILTGFNNLAFVFLATDNEHWCSRPTLPDGLLANISDSEWKERFIPYNNNDSESYIAETIGPKFRIALNVCYGYGWIIGLLLLPGIVWLAQDWRKLLIVQAAFSVSLLFALPWLYESPRWLVSVGKQAEAVEAIRKIARFNKKQLGDVEKEVEGLMKRKLNAMQGHQSNVSVIGLFKTKYLRRNTLVLVTVSFLSSIVYYGFSRTATTLGGNPYLNFGIAAALECTGYTVSLVTTKYLKRIPTMFSSYGFFSLTLLITAFTPREYLVLRTTIRMAGWFTYTLGYTTQFVFENEMFPTVARSGGFGLCSTIGRLGATLEPWINVFDD